MAGPTMRMATSSHDMTEPAFDLLNAGGDPRLLLVCDHASNAIPPAYQGLGLPAEALSRHIAWDIGAADVTRALSRRLNAPAVLARFSRLLIDPNRGEDDPTLVMQLSDGDIIAGNARVSPAEVAHRIARFHAPYHRAIAAAVDRAEQAGVRPALVSLHSFTPVWKGVARPWHYGVLWDRDGRIAQPLLAALRAVPGLVVGDNEPYSGELEGDCMSQHGTARGLAHVLLEIRQDLIDTTEAAERVAAFLAPLFARVLGVQDAG